MASYVAGTAAVIAGIEWLFSKGKITENVVDFQNTLISNSVFNVLVECTNLASTNQTIQVTCGSNSGKKNFKENLGCQSCVNAISEFVNNRNRFETEAASQNRSYTPEIYPGGPDGWSIERLCQLPCNDCIVQGITQTSSIDFQSSCVDDTTFEQSLSNEINTNITEVLTNNEDALAQVSSAFTTNIQKITNDYSKYMASEFTANVKTQLVTDLKNIQNIQIGTSNFQNNHSFYVNNLQQTIHTNVIVSMLANTRFVNDIVDKTDYEATLNNMYKNDTTGDISGAISRTVVGLGNIFSDTVGKMVIIMVLILVGVIAVGIGIAVAKPEAFDAVISQYNK